MDVPSELCIDVIPKKLEQGQESPSGQQMGVGGARLASQLSQKTHCLGHSHPAVAGP